MWPLPDVMDFEKAYVRGAINEIEKFN